MVLQHSAGKLGVLFYSKCRFCCNFKPSALLTLLYTAWYKSRKTDRINKWQDQFCLLYTFRLSLYLTLPNSSLLEDIRIFPILSTILLFFLHFLFFSFWILLYFLYSRSLLVIYFIHISVYMSIPISQFITPPHLPLSPLGVHTFVLYICVSTSALQTGSSVPFF